MWWKIGAHTIVGWQSGAIHVITKTKHWGEEERLVLMGEKERTVYCRMDVPFSVHSTLLNMPTEWICQDYVRVNMTGLQYTPGVTSLSLSPPMFCFCDYMIFCSWLSPHCGMCTDFSPHFPPSLSCIGLRVLSLLFDLTLSPTSLPPSPFYVHAKCVSSIPWWWSLDRRWNVGIKKMARDSDEPLIL